MTTPDPDNGLCFPRDLQTWQRWSASHHRVRDMVHRMRHPGPDETPDFHLLMPQRPRYLAVIDVWSPSCQAALGASLAKLDPDEVAILTALPDVINDLGDGKETVSWQPGDELPHSIREVITLGVYSAASEYATDWAVTRGARFWVVQHGLLTPWAQPLSSGAHLLAWSQADAQYWSAGRPDVVPHVVGSQLMWDAAHMPEVAVKDQTPVLLGQLHGSELPRRDTLSCYLRFCRTNNALYRPHPNEKDLVSRVEHRLMRRAGIVFEQSGLPLVELGHPVVSIFSTGTLEAAQRGLPAWVYHPNPPAWVRDFWSRYGLHSWGDDPTPRGELPGTEPAVAIAEEISR